MFGGIKKLAELERRVEERWDSDVGLLAIASIVFQLIVWLEEILGGGYDKSILFIVVCLGVKEIGKKNQ